jgi:CDP-diacylglycerol--glycerol-3-phosphate 3-phosphatidyltransferase
VSHESRSGGLEGARAAIRRRTKGLLESIASPLARAGVSPNVLTLCGLLAMIAVACVLSLGHERLAGLLLIPVALLDALDGALARLTGKATRFGAFFDSTLDRFAEIALYLGLLYLYRGSTLETVLIYLTITGSLMVSYTRARAEGLGLECKVGLFTRLERLAVLTLGLLLEQTLIALIILAIFSNLTVLQRVWHVRKVTAKER